MTIETIATVQELVAICAELVRQGIKFRAYRDVDTNLWTVAMTGGF